MSAHADDVDRPISGREMLRDRSVAAYLTSIFLATLAVSAQVTALGFQVFELTGRELDLGLLGLAEFTPAALLVVVAGGIADRYDRRRVVTAGMASEAMCSVALAVLAGRHRTSLASILVVVVLFGVARAFQAPAARALPSNIVPAGHLARMMAMNSIAWQAGLIAGPVIGGLLYVVAPAAVYSTSAALLAVGAAIMLAARIPARPAPQRLPDGAPDPTSDPVGGHSGDPVDDASDAGVGTALEGLRYIRRTPILLGAISLDLFAVLFGGAIALLPAIAEKRLGVGPVGLGGLRAAGGIGATATGFVLATRSLRRNVGRKLFVAVAVFGAATIVLGLTRSYAVAFAMMVVLSAADAISVNVRSTLVPLVVPDEFRGRVLAVENVFIGASNEFGAFESGVVGQVMGASGAIVLGGVATLVVVAVWSTLFPALRDVDRFEDL